MSEMYKEMSKDIIYEKKRPGTGNLTQELDKKIESEIILMLQTKLQKKNDEAEVLKSEKRSMEIEVDNLSNKIEELVQHKQLAQDQINRIKELKNLFEKEVAKLKEEIFSQKNYIKNLKRKIYYLEGNVDQLYNEQEKGEKGFKSEVEVLRDKIKELESQMEEVVEEKEDFRSKLQMKEEAELQLLEEKRARIQELELRSYNEHEKKLEKITRLINENATLAEKLAESEQIRKKHYEKNKLLSKEMKDLESIIQKMTADNKKLKKEAKDVRLARTTNGKVLEKKIVAQGNRIKELEDREEEMKREIAALKLQKKGDAYDNFGYGGSEDEDLKPVKAKPTLFGEFDPDED